jgi:MYXO-CTERM domain-containing protein
MVSYYDNLLNGKGRADAMHDAQLAMMADPRTKHPHHWAAFIVSGETRPITAGDDEAPQVSKSARGCACRMAEPSEPPWMLSLLLLLALAARRRHSVV